MTVTDTAGGGRAVRRFLMLQGPHGPFFRQLGAMLDAAGAEVWRVGFNRGDEIFWGKDRMEFVEDELNRHAR